MKLPEYAPSENLTIDLDYLCSLLALKTKATLTLPRDTDFEALLASRIAEVKARLKARYSKA